MVPWYICRKYRTHGKTMFTASIDCEVPVASITTEEFKAHCFSSEMVKGLAIWHQLLSKPIASISVTTWPFLLLNSIQIIILAQIGQMAFGWSGNARL